MAGFGDELFIYRGPTGVTDQSESGNDATPIGGVTTVEDTDNGGTEAFVFDGVDNALQHASLFAVDAPRTISLWFTTNSVSRRGFIYGGGTTSGRLYVDHLDDSLRLRVGSNGFVVVASILPDVWYQLTLTYNGEDLSAYLDGVLQATQEDGSVDVSVAEFGIIDDTEINVPFSGRMDDLRAWGYVLGNEKIAVLATARGVDDITATPSPRRRRNMLMGGSGL